MKLQDCILEVDKVVVSSQEYIGPDEKWLSAKEMGYIPKSLYSLYSLANYFAFGKAPLYFNDNRRLLFPLGIPGRWWGNEGLPSGDGIVAMTKPYLGMGICNF